jgi:hypothetical protein
MSDISRRQVNRLFAVAVLSIGGGSPIGLVARADAAKRAALDGHLVHPQKGLLQMTQDVSKLVAEYFEALIGETFAIGDHKIKLRAVVRRRPATPARFREQFSLTFEMPTGATIRSDVVPVAHPAIGRHDLLVTQVVDTTDLTALEICFA